MNRKLGLLAVGVVAAAVAVEAGDLEPPTAPAPTMVPLDQLATLVASAEAAAQAALTAAQAAQAAAEQAETEAIAAQDPRTPVSAETTPGDGTALFVIDEPGSYYLTGDVTGRSGQVGIRIAADNVTLDLGGFALQGVTGSLSGIVIEGRGQSGFTVRNGIIRQWGDAGIVSLSSLNSVLLEALVVVGNDEDGAELFAKANVVRSCEFRTNGGHGLYVFDNARVTDCVAAENALDGFDVGEEGTFSGCTAQDNGDDGFDINSGATLLNCNARRNGGDGFDVSSSSTLVSCVSRDNGNVGFRCTSGSTLQACTAALNSSEGFIITGSMAAECIGYANSGDGFRSSYGSLRGCVARLNEGDGFQLEGSTLVLNCTALSNGVAASGGAGIFALGTGNRIDGNHVLSNDRGIDVDTGGNIIVRNTARGNTTDIDIAAGNDIGDIIDLSSVTGEFTTGTPWSNFEF